MSATRDALVRALVAERKRQGLSQREVGRRAGLSTGGFCEAERGDHSPMLSNLRAWAEALGFRLALMPADATCPACQADLTEHCGACGWVR